MCASANGSFSAFACAQATLPTIPASMSRSRPSLSMAALMSESTTRPACPPASQDRRQVAGAAGHVERALAGVQARERQRELLPQPVHAARHQVVHQVVVAGDGVEHAADAPLLLAPGHAFVAEIGVGGLVRVSHRAASIDGSPIPKRKGPRESAGFSRRAFATKPNYSSGGLGKAGCPLTAGLFFLSTRAAIASGCAANSKPAFGRLRDYWAA